MFSPPTLWKGDQDTQVSLPIPILITFKMNFAIQSKGSAAYIPESDSVLRSVLILSYFRVHCSLIVLTITAIRRDSVVLSFPLLHRFPTGSEGPAVGLLGKSRCLLQFFLKRRAMPPVPKHADPDHHLSCPHSAAALKTHWLQQFGIRFAITCCVHSLYWQAMENYPCFQMFQNKMMSYYILWWKPEHPYKKRLLFECFARYPKPGFRGL